MSQPAPERTDSQSEHSLLSRRPGRRLRNWVHCKIFGFVRIDAGAVERLRELAGRGSVVYVMRYRSWLDYFVVTAVLRREGLHAPKFVNDLSPLWSLSLREMAAALWQGIRGGRALTLDVRRFEERARCRRLIAAGEPVLLFMRGPVPGVRLFTSRRRALIGVRTGTDYLREIVHAFWTAPEEVSLVPLALLRGRGLRRKEARQTTLVYSAQDVPGEIRRLVSLLWNARDTKINAGVEVRLRDFLNEYRREGEERTMRRLARALQIFLYREERVVWGPPLLSKRLVRQRLLEDEELLAVVRRLAAEGNEAEAQLRRRAGRYLDEMAANFNGIYFSIIEFAFNRIWPRVFLGIEHHGLDKVAERVKQHPVVLVPCHRSHFDYLILSYLFHINYLSPLHIAAGINLSFWPLGPLFRGAGAYFIRRSFEGDDLYKIVFRTYLTFLIREGYTQEFFIEGGRSRTGKVLTPKLGMLSAIVNAFVKGVRRDLYLVPVSIHYDRVVEEESYQRELSGGEKQKESLGALLQARRILRRRHGKVHVTFAEPISLNEALGVGKDRFHDRTDDATEEEKRRVVQKLGFQLLRRVNAVAPAGATSVSATALLSLSGRACRYPAFVSEALALAAFLRAFDVRFTESLERSVQDGFRENLTFLENGGLVRRLPLGDEESAIHVPDGKRSALDFYKNNTIHFLLLPGLVVDGLARGLGPAVLTDDVVWWLDLFRWDFPLPEGDAVGEKAERVVGYLRRIGALAGEDGAVHLTDHPFARIARGALANFRESYWIAAQVLAQLPESGWTRKTCMERMRARFESGLLLGEIHRSEGNSSVTFGNAMNRFAEMDCIVLEPGEGKDRPFRPGPRFAELPDVAGRIARSHGPLVL